MIKYAFTCRKEFASGITEILIQLRIKYTKLVFITVCTVRVVYYVIIINIMLKF